MKNNNTINFNEIIIIYRKLEKQKRLEVKYFESSEAYCKFRDEFNENRSNYLKNKYCTFSINENSNCSVDEYIEESILTPWNDDMTSITFEIINEGVRLDECKY